MTTKFLRRANDFSIVDSNALNIHDVLPPGNYTIQKTPENVMYLQMAEPFSHPPKMYGHTMEQANRILQTFKDRPRGTGVLLSGEKGSGKTLLARTVSIEAAKEDIPTLIINAPWQGEAFFAFLCAITQPLIVLFDEFEKTYDTKKNEQDAILTLLDGVFPSKKLFMLTCNDRYGINTNMINRPGRIFYSMEFRGLDPDFILEYIMDNLKDTSHADTIMRTTSMFSEFNFDMLQALVEEMNRYGESPAQALTMLNVSPVHDYGTYKVSVLLASGEEVITQHTQPDDIRSPLSIKNGIHINVYTNPADKKAKSRGELVCHELTFFPSDIISANDDGMCLKNKEGHILNLTRPRAQYDWRETIATTA
jgi:hypothetical protein